MSLTWRGWLNVGEKRGIDYDQSVLNLDINTSPIITGDVHIMDDNKP